MKVLTPSVLAGDRNPGGADTQVQFNNGGNLAGSADLTWDDTGKELGVGGDINLDDGGTYATTLQLITPTANRTISFPDATGTVGLVAGSSGQLVYNNAGAYAGDGNLTWDATTGLTLGRKLLVNEASGFTGDLFDFQVAGSSKLALASSTYLRLGSGTGGIQFNGDTAATNALDDYEEGTFALTMAGSSTAGTVTYGTRKGTYTKIGNLVTARFYIDWNSFTGTGDMRFGGLPFAVSNDQNASACVFSNVALPAGTVNLAAWAFNSQTYIVIVASKDNGLSGIVQCDASGIFYGCLTYNV